LLAIDDPLPIAKLGARAQAGEVAAGPRLAETLGPTVFAAQGLGDEVRLLPLLSTLQQGRHEHLHAAPLDLAGRIGALELFGDDARLDDVRPLLGAAKASRDAAVEVASFDRAATECGNVGTRRPRGREKLAQVAAEGLVL